MSPSLRTPVSIVLFSMSRRGHPVCFVLFCFVLFCFVLSALVDVDATIASKWWWYVFGRASGCMGVWVVLCVLVSAAFVF